MNESQNKVREWMRLAHQETPSCPEMPVTKIRELRESLIAEEFREFRISNSLYGDLGKTASLTSIADDLADILYVVYGSACAYGIDIAPVFEEVHRSNMSKFIDGHLRPDGKWIKGPSYTPPNIKPIIQQQINQLV